MVDVVCLGEVLVDFVAEDLNVALENVVRFRRAPGGAPANVACGVVKLGGTAAFVGKVGDDPFGRMLTRTLGDVGVDTSHLAVSSAARTTLVFVGVHRDGRKDMCFYRHPGADMMLSAADIDAAWLASAKALHFGSISLIDPGPREATLRAARIARQAGLLVTFDPNYRQGLWPSEAEARHRIAEGLALAEVVKVADEELRLVAGSDDHRTAAEYILAQGPHLAVISCGAEGSHGFLRGDVPGRASSDCPVPGFRVKAVETTGAGDGFMASLLVDLLAARSAGRDLAALGEDDLRRIYTRANAVGALTCTRAGAIPGLPTRDEVDRFLAGQPGR